MKNIIILLIFIGSACNAQVKNFFKYSTFYTSMNMNTSFIERDDIMVLKRVLQTMLLLAIVLVGSIYLIIHLYVIVVISLLSRISGLDTLDINA